MRRSSRNTGYIFLVNRKFILGAILFSMVLYGLAGTGGFESAEAAADGPEVMPEQTHHVLQDPDENMEVETESENIIREPASSWDVVQMRVTAYCWCSKCCGKHSDGITANGHRIRIGDTFVAADRKYSFDTEMVIPGYNDSQPVKVLDRGGAIHGNKLDVFFNSHQRALEWGVQNLVVKIRVR